MISFYPSPPSTAITTTPPTFLGLYSNEHTNLNLPMLGMWDMNDRNTVKMVTESIAHLERKVVYIIPFSQLRVDTRYDTIWVLLVDLYNILGFVGLSV